MSDLARERDGRRLWVSRSHLHAAAAGAVLSCVASFGVGFLLGQHKVASADPPPELSLVSGVSGEGLLELLARVEAGAAGPDGEADVLRYPDLLKEGVPLKPPVDEATVRSSALVEAPVRPGEAPPVDPVPAGELTVTVGSFAAQEDAVLIRDYLEEHLADEELDAWMTVAQEAGLRSWVVSVGAYDEALDAELAQLTVADVMASSPVTVGEPKVVPLGD